MMTSSYLSSNAEYFLMLPKYAELLMPSLPYMFTEQQAVSVQTMSESDEHQMIRHPEQFR